MTLPGPAPYSIPPASGSTAPMGPPPIRLQTPVYAPQPSAVMQSIRPTMTASPSIMPPPLATMAPPPLPEERPQDAEQLQDALASAGVDLKAEEFNLSQIVTPSGSIPQPNPFMVPPTVPPQHGVDESKLIFNRLALSRVVDRIGISSVCSVSGFDVAVAKQFNIPRLDNDVIMLLSLALEHRLRHLISQMCLLARHRTSPLPPNYTSRSNSTPIPTLLDLARSERQKEEQFQSRKRARTADKDGPAQRVAPSSSKPSSNSTGPASRTARRGISMDMTSEAQKRSTDTTVNVMLGGGRKKRYSWMDAGSTASPGAGSPVPASPGVASPISTTGTNRDDEKLRGRFVERAGWVTLKDALEALEGDGGGESGIGLSWEAGGKALWRGWAKVKD
jgi:hypothetical protein